METPDPKYKHKPSEKHTLEEVLKSLQDLIRNDLAEGAGPAGKPQPTPAESRQREGDTRATTEIKLRREHPAVQREDFAPASPASGVNLDAVMRSLKDLIGNELNVGDEPKPLETKSASTHEEYLATEEKIEEYIPEELGRLDDELNIGEEQIPEEPEPTPPRDESLAPEEIIGESLPEEFTPLDEALTFEESVEAAPPAPALPETPELPGEISPELLGEPEATPPPAVPETPVTIKEDIVPGTQHEMSFEEPPPIELRVPPPAEPETAPASEPEISVMPAVAAPAPEPMPETPATPVTEAPQSEDVAGDAMQALPTIEVEESFDTGNYFDGAALSAENSASALEEIVVQDMEISNAPETTPPAVETSPAAPTDAVPTPEPTPPPVEKKVNLELASEPPGENPHKASVDFDALDLESSRAEPAPPRVDAEIPAPEAEPPAMTTEPGAGPAPEPESPKATEEAPATETKAETASETEQPAAPVEPGATDTPPSFNLDDIPVLNEVVAPPAGSVPTAKPAAPPPAASALPAPDRARDIVVRAVAKLNIEMRKSGSAGLDTRTILRLQQLIREELEKGGKK